MESVIKKLGKTSITVEKDYHSSEKEYNKLTVVEEQGAFKTYLSRKPVPIGIELTNREYWIPFSGIKESLIIDYEKFKKEINNNINPIVIGYLIAHPELIVNVQNKSINIPKLAKDVIDWFDKLQIDINTESNTARLNEQKNTDAIYSEINRAKAVELSIQKTLENITKTGEASAASNVTYIDNIEVGSTNLQDVIDKVGKKTLDEEKKLSELGEYNESKEFIRTIVDKNGKLLAWIDKNGHIGWFKGLPKPISEIVLPLKENLEEINTHEIDDNELSYVITDINGKVLVSINKNGYVNINELDAVKIHSKTIDQINAKINNIPTSTEINSKIFIGGNKEIKNCFGFNAHFGQGGNKYDNYFDNILEKIIKGGYNLVRTQISPKMTYLQEKGIELCSCMYDVAAIDESSFVSTVTEALNKYNGVTKIIRDDGKEVTCNCKYWEFFNELDLKWIAGKTSTEQAFNMYKLAYKTVKSVRPDAYVVLGGLASSVNGFVNALCEYKDQDGYKFWDLFDIFNIHSYSIDYNNLKQYIDLTWNIFKKYYDSSSDANLIDKPIWMSEFNAPSYNHGDYEQSLLIPTSILIMLSSGFDAFENYEIVDNDSLMTASRINSPAESFFGLCRRNYPNCSYASFLKNDGIYNTALSAGDDLKRYFFSSEKICYIGKLNNYYTQTEYNNLKTTGLALSGKGFTITSIYRIKKYGSETEERIELWNGSRTINSEQDIVTWDSSYFKDIEKDDIIWFDVSNIVSTDISTCEFEPKPAYYAWKFLSKLLKNGTEKPNMNHDGNIISVKWKLLNGNNVTALWSLKDTTIKLNVSGYGTLFFDYLGNMIDYKGESLLLEANKIIYIINYKNLSYE